MARLVFEKKGKSIWISHLDLMRLFQRAFKRAGLPLKHTQGFNPRPSVSIALPLSVGVESSCELLDFDLECDITKEDNLQDRINSSLVDGVKVLDVYLEGQKIKDLTLMHSEIILMYDNGAKDESVAAINNLLSTKTLLVMKKTKNGLQEQDIIPMIRRFSVKKTGEKQITIELLHCCQNPTLNPMQIPAAIKLYLQDHVPDFCKCYRIEIYNNMEKVFR